jgi:secreted trypsin-like serine protease
MRTGARVRHVVLALIAVALLVGLAPNAPAGAQTDGDKIIGGTVASPGEYPYQIAIIGDPDDPFNSQFCGGSVIDRQWVLTAAHCMEGESPSTVWVLAGTNVLSEGGDVIPVSAITTHPSYNPITLQNDFSVLRLSRQVNSSLVPLIRSTQGALWPAGTNAVATGWGNLAASGPPDWPDDLYEVTVPVVSDATCALPTHYGSDFDPATMMCAGQAGKDTCQGDSGGPLVVPGPSGKPIQIGVTSWGEGCGVANKEGVYSRIANFQTWIQGVVGRPANDDFAAARVPACTVTFENGSTAFATEQGGEPDHAGNMGGSSLWYRFTAPAHAQFHINTLGSDGDTLLEVYTGASLPALISADENDDIGGGENRSALDFHAFEGITYYIAVDSRASSATAGPDRARTRLNLSFDTLAIPGEEEAMFPDVPMSHVFAQDIRTIANEGITSGLADCGYHPSDVVTRQSMAAFFYRLDGWSRDYAPDPDFSDVPGSNPFYREIAWMADEGITTGNPDGSFGTSSPVTRASMAAFFYRLAGSPRGTTPTCPVPPFPDVPTSHPFCGQIDWLVDEGVASGFLDGTYRPATPVARGSMAAFMSNFMEL